MNHTIDMESSLQKVRRAVILFVSDYYRRSVNTRVPSLREICRDEKVVKACGGACYPKKLEHVFPPELDGSGPLMKRICRASHVPAPTARIRKARKATAAKVKKAKKGGKKKPAKRDVEPAVTEVQETARQPGSLEDLQRSIEMEEEQRSYRMERAEEKAEEIKLLALDSREEISGPILNAIENTVLPVLFEKKYGIEATVPEILEMLEQYKKVDDEGWCVEFAMEWGILSEEEREAFRELYNKAYSEEGVSATRYLVALKGAMENLKGKKDQLLREIGGLNQKKKDLNWDYSLLKTRHSELDKDHEKRKKHLDDEYYEKARNYATQFSTVKKQFEDEIAKLIKERDRLNAKCDELEKTASKIVNSALQQDDKIKAQIAEGRAELKELARENEEIKAQLAERNQQLT